MVSAASARIHADNAQAYIPGPVDKLLRILLQISHHSTVHGRHIT